MLLNLKLFRDKSKVPLDPKKAYGVGVTPPIHNLALSSLCTKWIRRNLVGRRISLNALEKTKNLIFLPRIERCLNYPVFRSSVIRAAELTREFLDKNFECLLFVHFLASLSRTLFNSHIGQINLDLLTPDTVKLRSWLFLRSWPVAVLARTRQLIRTEEALRTA